MKYFEQLDGLRFVAVSLVLFDHWLAERNTLPLGPLGVNLFFVLSGFLITGILIRSKMKDDTLSRSHWFSFRQFYIRRSLRIFPVYYLSVFVLMALHSSSVEGKEWWHLCYATNLYIAIKQTWLGVTDHFWSLAVEEQFYLFFPMVIFLTPIKWLPRFFVGFVGLAVLLRILLFVNHTDWVVQYVSMPTSLDAFGAGALLAYFSIFNTTLFQTTLTNKKTLLLSIAAFVVVIISEKTLYTTHRNFSTEVLERLIGAIMCFYIIANAVIGYNGIVKWLLVNPVSNYFGKISYGLYVYHNFVFNYYHTQTDHFTLKSLHKIYGIVPMLQGQVWFELLYYFILTTLLATISWYFFEKYINNLKRYFGY
jgi:peptidoglycan/LPS O-acetylase OafA/YrhL